MSKRSVLVSFSREGEREGVPLCTDREYRVRVDNGTPGVFRSPWDQEELEDLIEILRRDGDVDPTAAKLKKLGRQIGAQLSEIDGLQQFLASGDVTIHLQLDYPELARLPWELATSNQPPYRHLLQEDVKLVRQIPGKRQDRAVEWPTGRNTKLRLLFLWGETAMGKVPHESHRKALEAISAELDIQLLSREATDIDSIADTMKEEKPFHFVHFLAHGAIEDGNWGLALRDEKITGGQLADALNLSESPPAMVSVAACDSANNRDNSFGSVAFELHASGIPFVHASQFRLRKTTSIKIVRELYEGILKGEDPLGVVHDIKRQLSPRADEGWVNEVVYCRYRQESLAEFFTVARQQAALRRARQISKQQFTDDTQRSEGLSLLRREKEALRALLKRLKTSDPQNNAAIAETCGLLGSIERRMAEVRNKDNPSHEDLYQAREFYKEGFQADANSHYCGINFIHLSLQMGEKAEAEAWAPMISLIAQNQVESDFWSWATAGEVEVYSGDALKAKKLYRKFVGEVKQRNSIEVARINIGSSLKQLNRVLRLFGHQGAIGTAAEAAIGVLENAVESLQS